MWRSVRFSCEPGFEDVLAAYIFESGFSGLEEHRDGARTIYTAYYRSCHESPDSLDILKQRTAELPVGSGERRYDILSVVDVPDEDWETSWREGLGPIEIGSRIVVRPSWTSYSNRDNRIEIIIDPKMAFGTGDHPTTRLCLEIIEQRAPDGLTVLDCGCGSGVLSIAAAMLGARSVRGFDNDPFSVENACENIRLNGVYDRVAIMEADLATVDVEAAHCVLANMISGVLLANLPRFHGFLKPGGTVVFSGLLAEEERLFTDALDSAGFRALETRRSGEWIAIVAWEKSLAFDRFV